MIKDDALHLLLIFRRVLLPTIVLIMSVTLFLVVSVVGDQPTCHTGTHLQDLQLAYPDRFEATVKEGKEILKLSHELRYQSISMGIGDR